MNQRIEVLLATYNGAEYLDDFLASLLSQTCSEFMLRVRDDGSKDTTLSILTKWQEKFNGRMHIVDSTKATGSAKGNFSELMTYAEADYILFADQDDVWSRDHVDVIVKLLEDAEREKGREHAICAFTDVTPVDANLNPKADSYFSFKGIDPSICKKTSQSIVCPPNLGCASGINRYLLNLAVPVPVDRVTGHDWWALLLASAVGHCVWSTKKTVQYRIHSGNSSAPKQSSVRVYLQAANKGAKVKRGMMLRREQANAVYDRLTGIADEEQLRAFQRFDEVMGGNFLQRRLGLASGRFLYPDMTRNIGMLLFC